MFEGEEDEAPEQEDIIPGDNDKPSDEKLPSNNDAPINLNQINPPDVPSSKDMGGD